MNKYLLIIIISGICFGICNSFLVQTSLAQVSPESAQKEGEISTIKRGIETLKNSLKEVLTIWKGVHFRVMGYWKENVLPKIQGWYERKKPEVEEEFKKEKTEMEQEIKNILSNSWQWLKDLIK